VDLQYQWTADDFFREERRRPGAQGDGLEKETSRPKDRDYRAAMIDQGFCFNAGEWNYPDCAVAGLYARNRVYEGVIGMESFAPWTEARREECDRASAGRSHPRIPPEWYEDDYDAVTKLLEQLYRRRTRVPELC